MQGAFAEIALLLLACALAGAGFVRLRQPALMAYIVVGIAAGPAVFGLVTAHDPIDLLAQVGVAVLLLEWLAPAIYPMEKPFHFLPSSVWFLILRDMK